MTESIGVALSAYLTGAASREDTRESLRSALIEGRKFTFDVQSLPSAQRDDIAALLQEAADKALGLPRPTRFRWRPFGYRLIASALGMGALASVAARVIWPRFADPNLALLNPRPVQVFLGAGTLGAAVAAWAIWTQRRYAPEVYAMWALLMLAFKLYFAVVLTPRVGLAWDFPAIAREPGWKDLSYLIGGNLAFYGLVYAYLAWRRPPAA